MTHDAVRRWPTAGDATTYAEPVGQMAERIDPDVITGLARWRGIDGHDLSQLGSVLTTHAGSFAGDSPGYLSALHGFVAEQVVYNNVAPSHNVVFPDDTTVPGWDIRVDGDAVQIKEGTHAAALVHEALKRYPQYREFFTDPDTAAELRAEGVDARGVPGLEPDRIASDTQASLSGADALTHAGIPQLPILTTLTTLLHGWQHVHEGRLDAATATREGAVDVGARGIGMALGVKAAAVGVVALGAYPFAIFALPAAAIMGAFGLQRLVNRRRSEELQALLEEFETTRAASEQSAEIVVDVARDELAEGITKIRAECEGNIAALRVKWVDSVADAEKACQHELTLCAEAVIVSLDSSLREAAAHRFAEAMGEPDAASRLTALDFEIEAELAHLPPDKQASAASDLSLARNRYRERCEVLRVLQAQIEHQSAADLASARRETAIAAVDAYAQVMQRTARLRAHVVSAFAIVDRQLAKLGRDAEPASYGL